jgi:hypothetical protein
MKKHSESMMKTYVMVVFTKNRLIREIGYGVLFIEMMMFEDTYVPNL